MISIELCLTNRCNLQCKYCFESNTDNINLKKSYKDMDFETAKKIINFYIKKSNQLNEYQNDKTINLIFFGGEPLLKFDLMKQIVSYAKYVSSVLDIVFTYSITTNATIFSKEIADFLIENKVNAMLSIDGNKVGHDANRIMKNGEGSFKLIQENYNNIKYFIKNNNCKTIIKMILDPSNVSYFYEGILFLSNFSTSISFGLNYEVKWNQKDYDIFVSELKKILEDYDVIREKDSYIEEIEVCIQAFTVHDRERNPSFCGAGKWKFFVTPDGEFYPCARFDSISECNIGNIYNDFNDNIKKFREFSFDNHECKDCKLRLSCNSTCIYYNYLFNKDIYCPDDFICMIYRTINYYCLKMLKVFQVAERGKS